MQCSGKTRWMVGAQRSGSLAAAAALKGFRCTSPRFLPDRGRCVPVGVDGVHTATKIRPNERLEKQIELDYCALYKTFYSSLIK